MAASSLDDNPPVAPSEVDAKSTAEKLDLDEKLSRLESQWEQLVRLGSTTAREQNESTSSGNWEIEKAADQEVLELDQLIGRLERQRELAAQIKSIRAQKRQELASLKSMKTENVVAKKFILDANASAAVVDLESQRVQQQKESTISGVGSARKAESNVSATTEEVGLPMNTNDLERPKESLTKLGSSRSGTVPAKTTTDGKINLGEGSHMLEIERDIMAKMGRTRVQLTSSGNMEKEKGAIGEKLDSLRQIRKLERQEEVLSRTPAELQELASSGNSEVATPREIDADEIAATENEVVAKMRSTSANSLENVKMKATAMLKELGQDGEIPSLGGKHRAKIASSGPKTAALCSKDQASEIPVQEECPIGLLKRESLSQESGQLARIDNEAILCCNSDLLIEAKEEGLKSGVSVRGLQMNHPWVEWNAFLDVLHRKNYFKDVPHSAFQGEGQSRFEISTYMRRAISQFSCDHDKIFRFLNKKDIWMIASIGCPSTERKVVNASKRLRVFSQIPEDEVCMQCKLKTFCTRAFAEPAPKIAAGIVDVLQVLYSFALNASPKAESQMAFPIGVVNSGCRLLNEVVQLSKNSRGKLALGEWMCPKCMFKNFNRNKECRECNTVRPTDPYRSCEHRSVYAESDLRWGLKNPSESSHGTLTSCRRVASAGSDGRKLKFKDGKKHIKREEEADVSLGDDEDETSWKFSNKFRRSIKSGVQFSQDSSAGKSSEIDVRDIGDEPSRMASSKTVHGKKRRSAPPKLNDDDGDINASEDELSDENQASSRSAAILRGDKGQCSSSRRCDDGDGRKVRVGGRERGSARGYNNISVERVPCRSGDTSEGGAKFIWKRSQEGDRSQSANQRRRPKGISVESEGAIDRKTSALTSDDEIQNDAGRYNGRGKERGGTNKIMRIEGRTAPKCGYSSKSGPRVRYKRGEMSEGEEQKDTWAESEGDDFDLSDSKRERRRRRGVSVKDEGGTVHKKSSFTSNDEIDNDSGRYRWADGGGKGRGTMTRERRFEGRSCSRSLSSSSYDEGYKRIGIVRPSSIGFGQSRNGKKYEEDRKSKP